MKTKSFRKKLVLNKSTVANLNGKMKYVYGGIYKTYRTDCNCNTILTCWTDATCCGAFVTDYKCPIPITTTPEETCDTELEC